MSSSGSKEKKNTLSKKGIFLALLFILVLLIIAGCFGRLTRIGEDRTPVVVRSNDNSVTLTVPYGSVPGEAVFSIEPLDIDDPPGAIALVYKIEPVDVLIDPQAELVFQYSEGDLPADVSVDGLAVARIIKNEWVPLSSYKDIDNQTLTVNVSRLGIYTIIELQDIPVDPLNLTLDVDYEEEKWLDNRGGSLGTHAADGRQYILDIPENALYDNEIITITPLKGIDNLPFGGGFVAGVNFSPDGLELYKPATLTIELPPETSHEGLIGFGYRSSGEEFYLIPSKVEGNKLVFSISSLSGYGAGSGSYSECINLSTSQEGRAKYLQQLSCVLSLGGADSSNNADREIDEAIESILRDWHRNLVIPVIQEAGGNLDDVSKLRQAAQEWNEWLYQVKLLGFEAQLSSQRSSARSAMESLVEQFFCHWDNLCALEDNVSTKKGHFDTSMNIYTEGQLMGLFWDDGPNLEELCGGVLDTVAEVNILPQTSFTIGVDEEVEVFAELLTLFDEPPINLHEKSVSWTSSNTSVAFVSPDPDTAPQFMDAIIKGVCTGTAEIIAECEDGVGNVDVDVLDISMSLIVSEGVEIRGNAWSERELTTTEDVFQGHNILPLDECQAWDDFAGLNVSTSVSRTRASANGHFSVSLNHSQKSAIYEWDFGATATPAEDGSLTYAEVDLHMHDLYLKIVNPQRKMVEITVDWEYSCTPGTYGRTIIDNSKVTVNRSWNCNAARYQEATEEELFETPYRPDKGYSDNGSFTFPLRDFSTTYLFLLINPRLRISTRDEDTLDSQTATYSGKIRVMVNEVE